MFTLNNKMLMCQVCGKKATIEVLSFCLLKLTKCPHCGVRGKLLPLQ